MKSAGTFCVGMIAERARTGASSGSRKNPRSTAQEQADRGVALAHGEAVAVGHCGSPARTCMKR
jgi:hypothetical protein